MHGTNMKITVTVVFFIAANKFLNLLCIKLLFIEKNFEICVSSRAIYIAAGRFWSERCTGGRNL
jgi:hypothetical protein